jgi:nucleoside-diphosphate-sugar epimerase
MRNLLAAAQDKGVRRFIFESFHGAYPDDGNAWIDESLPLRPVAPVMQSLIDGEALVNQFGAAAGEAVILRFARLVRSGARGCRAIFSHQGVTDSREPH